ncbi:hypothetical protein PG995_000928 [Apiospora arundinis]
MPTDVLLSYLRIAKKPISATAFYFYSKHGERCEVISPSSAYLLSGSPIFDCHSLLNHPYPRVVVAVAVAIADGLVGDPFVAGWRTDTRLSGSSRLLPPSIYDYYAAIQIILSASSYQLMAGSNQWVELADAVFHLKQAASPTTTSNPGLGASF